MDLKDKTVVVTGGSRGLGLGAVEALVAQGARVTVVARGADNLASVRSRLGVNTVAGDVTDPAVARRVIGELSPDVLILIAGLPPPMAHFDQMTWSDFTATWEHDVKAGLYWMQAALNLPLRPSSRVLIASSGAAVAGSPMSGGYGGAKRMLWLMANYANGVSQQKSLGLQFQVIVPRQMVLGTGTGDAGANAYSRAQGLTPQAFVARFGKPMSPRDFGNKVFTVLNDDQFARGIAFGLSGDSGITVLEPSTA